MYPSLGTTWNDVLILRFPIFGKWNQIAPNFLTGGDSRG